MDFTVLEARRFVAAASIRTVRSVKDYEIDLECGNDRFYTYGTCRQRKLYRGDILVRTPRSVVATEGPQDTYILTLDLSCRSCTSHYTRNMPGPYQAPVSHELLDRFTPVIHPENTERLMLLYQRLCSLPDPNAPMAKELVNELLYTLNAEICRRNYELLKPAEDVSDTIIGYMLKHLDRRITLEELAALVHLDKSYLIRLFRTATGRTPFEMLIAFRLDKASDLVANTEIKISDIASLCGYGTVSYFIAEYKKRYGMTPEAHRKKLLMPTASP